MSNDNGERQTNSIGDMLNLGIEFDEEAFVERLGFDGDEGVYRKHDGEERTVAFDIIWSETGTYPPDIEDPVVEAILDDDDHRYRIAVDDRERTFSPTGLAMCAYLDEEVEVEVSD